MIEESENVRLEEGNDLNNENELFESSNVDFRLEVNIKKLIQRDILFEKFKRLLLYFNC